jgi:hypothetical protein
VDGAVLDIQPRSSDWSGITAVAVPALSIGYARVSAAAAPVIVPTSAARTPVRTERTIAKAFHGRTGG